MPGHTRRFAPALQPLVERFDPTVVETRCTFLRESPPREQARAYALRQILLHLLVLLGRGQGGAKPIARLSRRRLRACRRPRIVEALRCISRAPKQGLNLVEQLLHHEILLRARAIRETPWQAHSMRFLLVLFVLAACSSDDACRDDAFEENDTLETAVPIGSSADIDPVLEIDAELCDMTDMVDWFSIDLEAGDNIEVFVGGFGTLGVTVFDPSGAMLAERRGSSTPSVELTAPVDGTYSIQVDGCCLPTIEYSLRISFV